MRNIAARRWSKGTLRMVWRNNANKRRNRRSFVGSAGIAGIWGNVEDPMEVQ